ncbi:hypothetical protein B0T22DRAFT_436379 [Podospora appendiculata]|uniref:BTB domain-containing protein n=1 Tax=Podospora appendiculata TaxID=314037 RepID=A0AAE0XGW4_9PEZI|nr:hypothetical protein B0T22DRAFT_436379 [Podospora appendiculata]
MDTRPLTELKRVVLDKVGDLVLLVKGSTLRKSVEFLVSSKTLSQASPVFAVMLGPNFKEGQLLCQGGQPQITLEEDDVAMMKVLLAILHCKADLVPRDFYANHLARFAIQCEKYDRAAAVWGWALLWCGDGSDGGPDLDNKNVTNGKKLEDLVRARRWSYFQSWDYANRGFRVLATHLLLPPGPLKQDILRKYIKNIPPNCRGLWEGKGILRHLPQRIMDNLTLSINKTLRDILEQTENIAKPGGLMSSRTCFRMPGQECLRCG